MQVGAATQRITPDKSAYRQKCMVACNLLNATKEGLV